MSLAQIFSINKIDTNKELSHDLMNNKLNHTAFISCFPCLHKYIVDNLAIQIVKSTEGSVYDMKFHDDFVYTLDIDFITGLLDKAQKAALNKTSLYGYDCNEDDAQNLYILIIQLNRLILNNKNLTKIYYHGDY